MKIIVVQEDGDTDQEARDCADLIEYHVSGYKANEDLNSDKGFPTPKIQKETK